MSILNIRKAVRSGSRVVIGIAGQSGEGKTYTALKIARGMVDKPEEIGFLDTENRRGSLYADILDGQFLIGDLYAPFSPQRYADAIKEFQDAGVKVLVIDSGSHEHEGEGGLEDIANAPLLAGKRMADWKKAKSEHKKFMNAMLQSDMHIILCLRAREKTDFKNPKQPVSLGIQPICEKNVLFEMTASMMMFNQGQNQQFIKMPEALRPIFGNGNGYLNESHGKALIDWVNSGEKIDTELESHKNKMQFAASSGTESLKQAWQSMSQSMQQKMEPLKRQYWASAQAFDEMAKEEAPQEQEKPKIKQAFQPAQKKEPEPEIVEEAAQEPKPANEIEEF